MEIVKGVLVVLHLLGMAAVVGGFLAQMKDTRKKVGAGMVHGALTALVTGLLLVGVVEMGDLYEPDHVKIGVKLVIALVVAVLAFRYRKAESVSTGVWGAIGGLTVLNVVIAVLW